MKYRISPSAMICVAVALFVQPHAACAQPLQNSKIVVNYEEPKKGDHRVLYERYKKREILEQLSQFLSPLRLPKKLPMQTTECGTVNAYYAKGKGLMLCYEYFHDLETRIAGEQPPPGYTREDAIVGGFLGVTFHEIGHAIFDILDVPVYGREEDASDQIAGFVVQQFGSELARRMISGAAYMWMAKEKKMTRTAYSDEHGSDLQRHYNFLCLGYGGQPAVFKEFVDKGALPAERARNCPREYQQVRNAFAKTVLPFVDQAMMKRVQSMQWLRAEDFR
jgi:hypothetical protein